MAFWLAVKIRRGLTVPQLHQPYEVQPTNSFGDLSQRLTGLQEDERILKIEVKSNTSNFKMEVNVDTPIAICNQFSAYIVEFFVENQEVVHVPAPANQRSATSVLMGAAMTRGRPPRKMETNNFDKLYNDILQYLEEKNISWSSSVVSTTGKKFLKSLTDLLWHITCHHDKFSERAAPLPSFVVEKFANYNCFTDKHQPKPKLEATKLRKYISDIVTFLTQPWMLKNATFLHDLNMLVDGCQKIADQMNKYSAMVSERQNTVTSYTGENVNMSTRKGCTGMLTKVILTIYALSI